jgi:hypothetical protein
VALVVAATGPGRCSGSRGSEVAGSRPGSANACLAARSSREANASGVSSQSGLRYQVRPLSRQSGSSNSTGRNFGTSTRWPSPTSNTVKRSLRATTGSPAASAACTSSSWRCSCSHGCHGLSASCWQAS